MFLYRVIKTVILGDYSFNPIKNFKIIIINYDFDDVIKKILSLDIILKSTLL